ncbi:MAG TPA: SRPBCC family protein [Pirellulales bacterium]|nr:SRPBCC family protein [Pirellulales bacterium]
MSNWHRLERTQFVARPREEVFAFFSDARNLEQITPAFLQFRVLNEGATGVHAGMLIDYRLKLFGIPLRWQSQIEAFEPGEQFVDVQLRGPYRTWRHLHEFRDAPGGTQMIDRVDYALPFGPLGSLAHALFVRRTLGKIFDFRREKIEELFGSGFNAGADSARSETLA